MADYDCVVIGSGPGGYVAAIRLAQLKQKVICVERDRIGGVCLNYGCIPSKALIHAAKVFEEAGHSEAMGIKAQAPTLDPVQLQAWKEGVVSKLTGGVAQLFKGNGVGYLAGEATLLSPTRVRVKTADGHRDLTTRTVLLATGGRPGELPFLRIDRKTVISSKEALELAKIPATMLIVGGGISGMEIASFLSKFGTKITIVEVLEQILPGVDIDLVRVVQRALRERGVEFFTRAMVKAAELTPNGAKVTFVPDEEEARTVEVEKVLMTVGTKPNVEGLGLDEMGVKCADKGGWVLVDSEQRTNIPNTFAIGDCTGPPFLAHRASKQGIVAAEVIAGHPAASDWQAMPGAVFTDPEIATVGITQDQAKAQGMEVLVGKFPFAALGRAVASARTEGFVKLLFEKESKRLVGAHIVGGAACEMISELALAMEMGASAEDIAQTVHPHPTHPEAVMEAAEVALGRAVHIIDRRR